MELSIGTEMREEYLSWELGDSARKLVEGGHAHQTRRERGHHCRHLQRHEGCPSYCYCCLCCWSNSHRRSLSHSENSCDGTPSPCGRSHSTGRRMDRVCRGLPPTHPGLQRSFEEWSTIHLPHRDGCHDDGQNHWKGPI